MPDTATAAPRRPPLDDETAAALTLFNTYLVADREQRAHERAVRKAERAKDEAAAAVRGLSDAKASAAESAEAETAYREAVETLRRLRGGDRPAVKDAAEGADADAEDDAADNDAAAGNAAADDGDDSDEADAAAAHVAAAGGEAAAADDAPAGGS